MQTGDRRAAGVVDLECQKIVAAHPRRPRADDRANGAIVQLRQCQGRIVDVDVITGAAFVRALRNSRRGGSHDAADRAKNVFDDVPPMRIHIHGEPASAASLVVPARPLALALEAVKHPPAEIETKPGDLAKKLLAGKVREFLQPGQKDLVLHLRRA